MIKYIKIIFINLCVAIFSILFIEFIVIIKNKNQIKCSYVLCNYKIVYENKLYKPFNKISYEKDEYGLRGRKKDVSKIDILVFGGSTTDERYLNLEDTWAEKLELFLNKDLGTEIDIVNAGIDGQSSFGHIWNFENWINKIESINPKFIFFYIGINESENSGYWDLNSKDLDLKKKIKLFIKNNNGFIYQLYQGYQKLKIVLKIDINPGHGTRTKDNSNYKLEKHNGEYENKKFSEILKNNIKSLHQHTTELGAIPIFITQRTLMWFKNDKGELFNLEDGNSYQVEYFKKNVILEYCKNNNLFCIDVFEKFDMQSEDTYDLVHLTPSGANKIATIISKEILNNKYIIDFLVN